MSHSHVFLCLSALPRKLSASSCSAEKISTSHGDHLQKTVPSWPSQSPGPPPPTALRSSLLRKPRQQSSGISVCTLTSSANDTIPPTLLLQVHTRCIKGLLTYLGSHKTMTSSCLVSSLGLLVSREHILNSSTFVASPPLRAPLLASPYLPPTLFNTPFPLPPQTPCCTCTPRILPLSETTKKLIDDSLLWCVRWDKSWALFFFKGIFLVRKIGLELTFVANLPLFFFHSTKFWYIVVYPNCRSFKFFCVRCWHSMAQWAMHRSVSKIWTGEPQATNVEQAIIATQPSSQDHGHLCLDMEKGLRLSNRESLKRKRPGGMMIL